MKELFRREKKLTRTLAGVFVSLILLHTAIFISIYYQSRPVYLVDPDTVIARLEVSFDDQQIILIREDGIWYEKNSQYYADHPRIEKIQRYLQEIHAQKLGIEPDEPVLFTLKVNGSHVIDVYSYSEETNRTIAGKEGDYYALRGNILELISRRQDRYLSTTVVPEAIWKKVDAVSFRKDQYLEFVRNKEEDSWKQVGNDEELIIQGSEMTELIMSSIFLHLDFTGLSVTEVYGQVDVKLYFLYESEMSLYYYYPASGEGLTYIMIPQYERTLGTRGFAGDFLELFGEQLP